MSETNSLTTWLLGRAIQSIQQRNIELPASTFRSDQVFEITLADGKEIILHCEFESGADTKVMSWRMQEYMHRLANRFKKDIYSVVIYLKGKGKSDTGTHKVGGVSWQYRVIHLWNTKARKLLDTQNPALVSLVGSAKLEEPEKELVEAIDIIVRKADNKVKRELLSILVALIEDERLSGMAETKIERDFFLDLDTPFIRRVKGRGREEGREEERFQIVKHMRQKGMDVQQISELTGLSIEEIKLLQN